MKNCIKMRKMVSFFVFICFTSTSITHAQTEQKLTASDAGIVHVFGNAVDMSGDYTIVGTANKNAAYIYDRNSGLWGNEVKVTPSDLVGNFRFGESVAIDGAYAIVGATWKNSFTGAAYIYKRNGSAWDEQIILSASDGATNDWFGWAIDIDGDYAAIGAWKADEGANDGGAVYIFKNNAGVWSQQTKLLAGDPAFSQHFGYSLNLNGNLLIVGAMDDPGVATGAGAVYIFRNNNGAWTQEAKLTASDAGTSDNLGWSVSIDGLYAAGAAFQNANANGSTAGAVYIFKDDGAGNWSEQTKLIAAQGSVGAEFGTSVSLRGNQLLVGAAKGQNTQGVKTGAAYLFTRSGSAWSETIMMASDLDGGDEYGKSVSLNIDGTTIITAPWQGPLFPGAAYVYDSSGSLPVELSQFSASVDIADGAVKLNWVTQSESNNFGFEVQRSTTGAWGKIGFVPGHGTTIVPRVYAFADALTDLPGTASEVHYRLKQIDTDGQFEFSNEIAVHLQGPEAFQLEQNFPNPFNPSTTITYLLQREGAVRLKIFDLRGREVRTLVNAAQRAGSYSVVWNGKDDAGKSVAGGNYFYRITAGDFQAVRKLLLLK